ncbi:hypothetical protein ACSLUB_12400 [Bordetella hinzii]
MLAEQPVKATANARQIALRSFSRQDGAAVLGISTIFFLLHGALEPRLSFKGCGPLGGHAGVVLALAMPVKRKQP